MRASTSYQVTREDARCKDAIKIVPGGAVHGRDDAPGLVMPKQRQIAARVKDRAVPSNGPKVNPRVGKYFTSNRILLVSLRCMAMDATTSALAGAPLCSKSLSARTTKARRHTSRSMMKPSAVGSCRAAKVRYLLTRSNRKLLRPDTSGRCEGHVGSKSSTVMTGLLLRVSGCLPCSIVGHSDGYEPATGPAGASARGHADSSGRVGEGRRGIPSPPARLLGGGTGGWPRGRLGDGSAACMSTSGRALGVASTRCTLMHSGLRARPGMAGHGVPSRRSSLWAREVAAPKKNHTRHRHEGNISALDRSRRVPGNTDRKGSCLTVKR